MGNVPIHTHLVRMMYTLGVFAVVFLTFPFIVILGVLVYVSSGRPVFFVQKRIGKNGTPFIIYKFRTMVPEAEQLKRSLLSHNESDGPVFKIHADPRFTRVGSVLSHTGLDELPQVWNVMRGDMAFIGPRPLPVEEARKLSTWMNVRHDILPGIISPAILTGKYHEDFSVWMKHDVSYVREKNLLIDTALLLRFLGFVAGLTYKEMRAGFRKLSIAYK